MHFVQLSLMVLASVAATQAQNISTVLASTPSLSNLTSALAGFPDIVASIASAQNVTILAPNNDAFTKLLAQPGGAAAFNNTALVNALFSYHILKGIHMADSITGVPGFVSTGLTDSNYTSLTGGQRVELVVPADNKTTVFSGLLSNATVVQANVSFSGGIIHIIDNFLTIPQNISTTLVDLNLTAAAGAITEVLANSTTPLPSNLTVFIPNNEAFQAIGSALVNISIANLSAVIGYHIVPNMVAYSTDLMNGTLMSATGMELHINVSSSGVTVNNAMVIIPDVLVSDGVIHVIDQVLNPGNTTATGDSPAFGGASSASGVPFTSAVPAPPTMVATSGAGAATSSSKAAAPMRTAAVGAAALFGGAAAVMNM